MVYALAVTTNLQIQIYSYLMYSPSHPSHVKNSIPFSKFLRLYLPISKSMKANEDVVYVATTLIFPKTQRHWALYQFFDKRNYPVSFA